MSPAGLTSGALGSTPPEEAGAAVVGLAAGARLAEVAVDAL
jgi:hypothetical protein